MATNTFEKIMADKGFFCDTCGEYIPAEKIVHRRLLEYTTGTENLPLVLEEEILCPHCRESQELYPFNPLHWSELKSYTEQVPTNALFVYPILKNRNAPMPISFGKTAQAEVVEVMAELYDLCIEITELLPMDEEDGVIVSVDFV